MESKLQENLLPPEQAMKQIQKLGVAAELESRRKDIPKRGRFPVPAPQSLFVALGVVIRYHNHNARTLTMLVDDSLTYDYFGIKPNMKAIEITKKDIEILGWNFRINRVSGNKIFLRPVGPFDKVGISERNNNKRLGGI